VSVLAVQLPSFFNPSIEPFSYLLRTPITDLTFQAEFAGGKVDPVEAGKQGGRSSGSGNDGGSSGGDNYKPTAHGGEKKDGGIDGRVKQ
jgi:hypothetical protein